MTRIRRAHLVHAAGARYAATTGTGRSLTFGDDPALDEQSPVEMIVAALAGCSAMDVWSIVEKKRQVVDRYEIVVEATQREAYPQILTEVTVTHAFWGADLAEAAVRRAVELSATKYCPVSAMLAAGATEIHHRYAIHGPGGETDARRGEVITTGPYRRPDVVDQR